MFLLPFWLPAVTILILVLILVLVLILILVIVLVLILVLVLIVTHKWLPPFVVCGCAATIACPKIQDLSFALKIKLTIRPATIAAVIPPAVAFSPPVSTPKKPSSEIASFTPLARE